MPLPRATHGRDAPHGCATSRVPSRAQLSTELVAPKNAALCLAA